MRRFKNVKIKFTLRCNNSCNFCYLRKGNMKDLSLELLQQIVKRLGDVPFKRVKINGGEPTLHRDFGLFSRFLRKTYPEKTMVLGTNGLDSFIGTLETTINCYDQVYISADDQHQNYERLPSILCDLRRAQILVVIHSIREHVEHERLEWLSQLCDEHGATLNLSKEVRFDEVGPPENEVRGAYESCAGREIVIMPNGAVHFCCKKDLLAPGDTHILKESFLDELFHLPVGPYPYCTHCELYGTKWR